MLTASGPSLRRLGRPQRTIRLRLSRKADALRAQLRVLHDEEMAAYGMRLREQLARADDWRLWAAGYLAAGGMSDDSFDYFRLWLVHQGQEPFERVQADPDRLADLAWDDAGTAFGVAEIFGHLVQEVLEERGVEREQGNSGPRDGQPVGEPFDEGDNDWFAATFPHLWARVSAAEDVPGDRSDRITGADVAAFVGSGLRNGEPTVTGPIAPLLAAHLFERGHLRHDERPILAAHWLAEGRDGEALLASLHGHEPEVSDLWPLALAELGVTLPGDDPRVAMRGPPNECSPVSSVRAGW